MSGQLRCRGCPHSVRNDTPHRMGCCHEDHSNSAVTYAWLIWTFVILYSAMVRGRRLSNDLREAVLTLARTLNVGTIAELTGCSERTIQRIVNAFRRRSRPAMRGLLAHELQGAKQSLTVTAALQPRHRSCPLISAPNSAKFSMGRTTNNTPGHFCDSPEVCSVPVKSPIAKYAFLSGLFGALSVLNGFV
ncbi:hypothetical protein DENSPDRAFT_128964 [Dentipellis sp. KUC8613]|nr:hypothetical protein DENSPDRAFT_128964 [Dentipellis sp. KUC8613]